VFTVLFCKSYVTVRERGTDATGAPRAAWALTAPGRVDAAGAPIPYPLRESRERTMTFICDRQCASCGKRNFLTGWLTLNAAI